MGKLAQIEQSFTKIQFNSKTRMRIFSKLSRYLGNGVPVSFALGELYKFSTDDGKKKKITIIPSLQ